MDRAFKEQAALVALQRMFRPEGFFDICVIESILKSLELVPPSPDVLATFRSIHCIHWQNMTPEFRRQVAEQVSLLFSTAVPMLVPTLLQDPVVESVPAPKGVLGWFRQ